MAMRTLFFILLFPSVCFGAVEGVWQGKDYKADTKVLYRGATVVSTDVMTEETVVKQEPDVMKDETSSKVCVSIDGGECEDSEYFTPKLTAHDPSKNYPDVGEPVTNNDTKG